MNESWQRLSPWAQEGLTAAVIMGGFLVVALAVRLLWMRVLGPLARRTATEVDDLMLAPLRGLTLWGLVLLGAYHALGSITLIHGNELVMNWLGRGLSVAWVVLAIVTVLRLFNRAVGWYVRRAAERVERPRDISAQSQLVAKVVNIVVLAIGVLYVLQAAGVSISPLLAGGAVGGLAVALALQDTLSNVFAGLSLNIDRPIAVGDFIKLESGDEGFVEEIGWRNTKVRLWANNLVVIPNQKLGQSIVTNYFLPEQEMSVYVWCGVAYDSDLQRVEDVTVQVAKEVMQQVPGTAPEWEPVVRWKEFGDFAITFVTVLRVKEFAAQYALQSEFVKALHRRFQQEGIEIPFPIRTVIMKQPAESQAAAGAGLRPPLPRRISRQALDDPESPD